MKIIIDTNSLLALVRYYLVFDKEAALISYIRQKIETGEIIVIDKVYEQCKYNSQGIILNTFSFLKEKQFLKLSKLPYKTEELLPIDPKQFFHYLEYNFVNAVVKSDRGLTDTEFENQKQKYLQDADMRMVILCQNLKAKGEKVALVTEESENSNDNKLFKKIPAICKTLGIQTLTIPEWLTQCSDVDIRINVNNNIDTLFC